jgi:undecaprenyl pyrophosphate phosphatase UppP
VLELLEAAFLSVVQGLTEFLSVSSSGHLLLSQYFLGMDQERFGLPFDAAIHTGTVLAVAGYLAIRFLLRFLANHTLRAFAYYRFALAAVVAAELLSSGS